MIYMSQRRMPGRKCGKNSHYATKYQQKVKKNWLNWLCLTVGSLPRKQHLTRMAQSRSAYLRLPELLNVLVNCFLSYHVGHEYVDSPLQIIV